MQREDFFASPASYRIQKTLKGPLEIQGVGLHSGVESTIRLLPADENQGIVFVALGENGSDSVSISGHFDSVVGTELATSLGSEGQARIRTVEHLMASVYALGLTNLRIEVEGPEIPILDGSALGFVERILDVGIELQRWSTPTLKVLRPIKVYQDGGACELLPRERLRLTTSVDFPHPEIGLQTFAIELTPKAFREELAKARTFGFVRDLEKLRSRHLAQGASLDSVLAFTEQGIMNPEGARYSDECVRHKLLDAIGDLALCGAWIEGELVSYRGGHSIHLALLKSLKAQASHWELLPAERLSSGSTSRLRQPRYATSG